MKVFISYKFSDGRSQELAGSIARLLTTLCYEPVTGKDVPSDFVVTEEVKNRIRLCSALISIAPSEVSGLSEWLAYEQGLAEGTSIPLVRLANPELNGNLYRGKSPIDIRLDGIDIAEKLISELSNLFCEGLSQKTQEMIAGIRHLPCLKKPDDHKTEYRYHITLGKHTSPELRRFFYAARFSISYKAKLSSNKVVIESAITANNFSDTYRRLSENPECIYRYILKSKTADVDFKKYANMFKVDSLRIEDKLVPAVTQNVLESGGRLQVEFDAIPPDYVNKEVSISIEIIAIVDKRWGEFTILFGYPVKGLEADILFESDTEVTDIDILDFVTSWAKPRRHPHHSTKKKLQGASLTIRDWIYPESGVVFLWNYEGRKKAKGNKEKANV
jgi:hypothetical protein